MAWLNELLFHVVVQALAISKSVKILKKNVEFYYKIVKTVFTI